MKHILQIPAHLYTGGVEKVARDIGMYADPEKYKVDYIVFDKEIGNYEAELIAHGSNVFHLQEPSLNYKKFLYDLKCIMSETQYDVVHAHTMFNIGWIMMIAKQKNIPIRIAHAHSALDTGGSIKVRCYEAAMRYLIIKNATDYIACGEKAGIRLFGKRVYKEKSKLVLNGIDTFRFKFSEDRRAEIRKKLNIGNSFVIGHVGHLANVKNQNFLIKLMPEVLKQKPDAVLLLLGEGPDRKMLEKSIYDLQLCDHVVMTGNVPNVYDFLNAMDVFAFPSLYEGMPLSILEVQANGLPCILSTGVPKDVYLTDLIVPLELSKPSLWVDAVCTAKRKKSEKYADWLKKQGFDSAGVMMKIFDIYDK